MTVQPIYRLKNLAQPFVLLDSCLDDVAEFCVNSLAVCCYVMALLRIYFFENLKEIWGFFFLNLKELWGFIFLKT